MKTKEQAAVKRDTGEHTKDKVVLSYRDYFWANIHGKCTRPEPADIFIGGYKAGIQYAREKDNERIRELEKELSEAVEIVGGLAFPCGHEKSFVRKLYGENGCSNFVAEIDDVHIKTARQFLESYNINKAGKNETRFKTS